MSYFAVLPPWLVLDPLLLGWLLEDVGRGDRTTNSLLVPDAPSKTARWIANAPGLIAGLPVAARVFHLLNQKISFVPVVSEGAMCEPGQIVAEIDGSLDALLMGERVALNLAMRLSGIATLTNIYVKQIADLSAQLVDTRKTTSWVASMTYEQVKSLKSKDFKRLRGVRPDTFNEMVEVVRIPLAKYFLTLKILVLSWKPVKESYRKSPLQ